MKSRILLIVGVALVLVGSILIAYSLQPKPVPPVSVLLNQSGWVNQNGVYFDSVVVRSYGSTNVTVVVEIEDLMDSKPRISDPVTLCPGCTATVQIEATQPSPSLSYDQYAFYTKQLSTPESVNVQYLSTVLRSKFNDDLTAGGAGAIIVGLFLMVRSRGSRRSRRRSRT
jgi:hypothetical protein